MPTNLAASAISASQVNVSWNSSTDNAGVAGYRVFRGGVRVVTTTGPSFADSGLKASTAYTYFVSAFDTAGNVSATSISASVTTLPVSATSTDATPPAVSLTTPMSSSTVFGTITLPASVFDNAGVKKVQFFIDGKLIGTDKTASSQSVSLPTFSAAQLAVYDGTNSSLPIYIGLNGLVYDVTAGSQFYAPRGPYYFLAGLDSSVQLNQIGGSIITSKYPVVGYLAMGGGQVINASGVFSVSWNTSCFANGRHPVTVKAFDIEGNSSISSVISVIVNNAPKKHHKDDDLDREDREKESSVHKDDSEHSPSGAQGNQRNWQGRGNGNAFGIQFQQSGNKQLSKEVKKNVRSED